MEEKQNKIWGKYTWYLFHTLVEKIKEENFVEEKNNLITQIKNISANLPCPDCSAHASKLLNSYKNYHLIESKENLINFIFEFQSIVNQKLEKEEFKKDDLKQYKETDLRKIVVLWNSSFKTVGVNTRMLTDTMRRNRIKTQFMQYIQNNIKKFES